MKILSPGNSTNDTYAEINLRVLKENFSVIKKFANLKSKGRIRICSVVKANGYGHGMFEIGKALSEHGTDYLGTADYFESIRLHDYLKKNSSKKPPVLCLGILTDEKLFEEVISRDIEITIANLDIATKLNNFAKNRNKKINVQIQVDSGINRIGFPGEYVYEAVQKLITLKFLNIKGIYSHFATSEINNDPYALKQLRNFKSLVKELEHNLIKFEIKHICNTGGILNYNDPFFNMVRPGISLYGYYPDRKKTSKEIGIKPVMTVISKVKFIKKLRKSQSISYGRKYFTKAETKIGSIPVGYGDGYSRILTNKSSVIINKKRLRTVGAICMDWTMINLGPDSDIKINDQVTIFGKEYPAYNLSEIMKTIPYEILCNITPRVPRIYLEN